MSGTGGQGGAYPILTPEQRKRAEKKVGGALGAVAGGLFIGAWVGGRVVKVGREALRWVAH